MTRPLIPRLPQPWRPRPLVPLLALLALAVCLAASAGVGLRAGARDSVPAAAVSHSVRMANFAFAPQTLTTAAGDSVTWTNQDEAPHTVTTTSGPRSISSPMLSKGQSFTYTFVAPGTYSYYCAVHPDMRAQIVVTAATAAPPPTPTTKPSTKLLTTAPSQPTRSAAGGVAHVGAPAMSHSAAETASPASPGSATPASAEAPVSTPTPAQAPAPDAAAASAADGSRPLDPALVLAGLTAGVTVFCLFLVASRRNDDS